MILKGTVLREISQQDKVKYHMTLLLCVMLFLNNKQNKQNPKPKDSNNKMMVTSRVGDSVKLCRQLFD